MYRLNRLDMVQNGMTLWLPHPPGYQDWKGCKFRARGAPGGGNCG